MKEKSLLSRFKKEVADQNSNVKIKQAIAIKRTISMLYYEQTLSNLDLGRQLFMTPPSVTSMLNNLIEEGIVEMKGQGTSNGGRKPMLYGLVPDFGYILSIDMDQYYTKMAIFNMHNINVSPVKTFRLRLNNERSTLEALFSEIHSLIETSTIDKSKILGIGLSIPGFVNTQLGINFTFLNFGDGKPLRTAMEEELGIPVFIENDASVLAFGESKFGLAKGVKNALVLKMNWGVGLGLILNGQLYRGHAGLAGEFSHIPIVDNEIICSCGKQGCLETETSALVLAKLAKEGIKNGKLSSLQSMVNEDLDKIEAEMVVKAANMGDQYSVQILSIIGYKLGKGISILMHLFNPELIILGGNMAKANQFLTIPIQQALNKYCIPFIQDNTRILVSKHEENGGLLGAVAMVFDKIFVQNDK
jgi:glucokinase-like ROK family protein